MLSPAVENLVAQLTRLPGVGTRTAHRLAFHLLRVPKDEAQALAAAIGDVKDRVRFCAECGNLTEEERCADLPRRTARPHPRLRRRAAGRPRLARADARVPRPLPRPRRIAVPDRRRRARAPPDRRADGPRRAQRDPGGRPRHEPEHDRRGDCRVPRRPPPWTRPRDPARQRPARRRRPRVRRRSHTRTRAVGPAERCDGDDRVRIATGACDRGDGDPRRHGRDEVRRHIGRRRRAPAGCRTAARRGAGGGEPRRRGAVSDGRHDGRPRPARTRDLSEAEGARARHADLRRRAHLLLALRDGDPRPRPRGDLAHRLAGRHRHGHRPRQGEDRRHQSTTDPRGARRRANRPRRRLPGRLDRPRHHDARPRRLGHDRGCARSRARRRGVRDLHRRRRRSHGRSARRAECEEAARGQLRGDARDGCLGRTRPSAALGRVRAEPRCQTARAVELLRGRRHVDPGGRQADAREGAHLRRDPQLARRRSTGWRA